VAVAVLVALVLGCASQAIADGWDQDGRGYYWDYGGYGAHYRWDGNGSFYSEAYGPGGMRGNYLRTPGYRGQSYWGGPWGTGGWYRSPAINNGQPVQWHW